MACRAPTAIEAAKTAKTARRMEGMERAFFRPKVVSSGCRVVLSGGREQVERRAWRKCLNSTTTSLAEDYKINILPGAGAHHPRLRRAG